MQYYLNGKILATDCVFCDGTGKISEEQCSKCYGRGMHLSDTGLDLIEFIRRIGK